LGFTGLLKFALVALLVWFLYRSVRRLMSGGDKVGKRPAPKGPDQVIDVMVQDPQCGTYLPKHEAIKAFVKDQERYFCSESCRDAFIRGDKPKQQTQDNAQSNG
jgi:uncharacterized protein